MVFYNWDNFSGLAKMLNRILFALTVLLCFAYHFNAQCPPGTAWNGNNYTVNDQSLDFVTAQRTCQEMSDDSDLVNIGSAFENSVIVSSGTFFYKHSLQKF